MATETDSVRTDAIGTIMTVLALVVIVGFFAVTALVRTEERNLAAVRETTANLRPLRELRAKHLAELNGAPTWVNRDQAVITIPISKAMELVVQEERIASKLPANDHGLAPSASVSSAPNAAPSPTTATGEKPTAAGVLGDPKQSGMAAPVTPSTSNAPKTSEAMTLPKPPTAGAVPTNSASP